MGRDRGRGKGGGRGSGKKMFIANVEELALREQVVNEREENRIRRRGEEDEDVSGEEEEEVTLAEKGGDAPAAAETVFNFERKSRAELEAEKAAARAAASSAKAGGADDEEEEDAPRGLLKSASNPNRANKMTAPKMLKVKDLNITEVTNPEEGLSRKEREAIAAQKAKDDYMRRHLAGETEQARADLARLALIKKKREEAAKQREAEGRAPGWTQNGVASDDDDDSSDDDDDDGKPPTKGPVAAPRAVAAPAPVAKATEPAAAALAAKKKAAAAAPADDTPAAADGGPPKLKAMDIKKLNGDAMKDALKARNLSTQGAKKDLMQRLLDYEAARP